MSSNARIYDQDLPPDQGYVPIHYKRIPCKTISSGYKILFGYLLMTSVGIFAYGKTAQKVHCENIEMRSANNIMHIILIAERDREFLKQLRRNRDEEEKLMSNVKGWVVGTWYGEPIYKTLPKTDLPMPTFHEYYAHTTHKAFTDRAYIKLMSSTTIEDN